MKIYLFILESDYANDLNDRKNAFSNALKI